ncbi:MAG: cell division protein ZapD [Bordetella sp.]|nr:MAG: cell division protein ZapD [Bordetella sp.]
MNIYFDYPLNERIRAYLRLQHLFDRFFLFVCDDFKGQLHETALINLINIIEANNRFDIKNLVLQDLIKYRSILVKLRDYENVFQDKLEDTLTNLEEIFSNLSSIQGKIGIKNPQITWLVSILNKLRVSGYLSPVDMPCYHLWLKKSNSERLMDLNTWIYPFKYLYKGIQIILYLIRSYQHSLNVQTFNGCFKKMLKGKSYHLLSIIINSDYQVFPAITSNKHMIWIQFFNQDNSKFLGNNIHFQILLFDGYIK